MVARRDLRLRLRRAALRGLCDLPTPARASECAARGEQSGAVGDVGRDWALARGDAGRGIVPWAVLAVGADGRDAAFPVRLENAARGGVSVGLSGPDDSTAGDHFQSGDFSAAT